MGIIVEDGTGLAGANSYASEDELDTYTDDRAITLATGDAEAALIRATAAIDAIYGSRFPGYKTNGRDQNLLWPRIYAYDGDGDLIDSDEIPVEIKNATCEAAVRELTTPGSMSPDLERGGGVKRLKAGSVEIEYGSNAEAGTTFSVIDGILSALLGASAMSNMFGKAVRG
jgi:hypothetical protein